MLYFAPPLLRDDSSKLVVSLWADPSTNQNMTSPSWQPIGWPQNRLRHDVGAGGRHDGANRTYSNAYEAYTTRSLVQNLRHALGRRIEVNIYHVILMFFSFFFLFHLFLLRWILDQFYHACVTYTASSSTSFVVFSRKISFFNLCSMFIFGGKFRIESPSIGPTKQSLRYHIGTIG